MIALRPTGLCLLYLVGLPLLLTFSGLVLAHSSARGLVMLLPTGFYIIGGALAVAATFLLLALMPTHWLGRVGNPRLLFSVANSAPLLPSLISLGFLMILLASGFVGTNDPLLNPLPLFIWTLWWVGFTLLQFVVGDLWFALNPWTSIVKLLKTLTGWHQAPCNLPAGLGYTPAVLVFVGFAWFELIDLAPEDPKRLATVVLGYWLLTLSGCLLFGEQVWLKYGEPFAFIFRLVGACSPIVRQSSDNHRRAIKLSLPAQGLTALPALPLSGVILLLLILGAVAFDGFSKTFSWLGFININPLEFAGRSGVIYQNTAGLIGAFACLVIGYFGCAFIGYKLASQTSNFAEASGRLIYSLVPILIAFHFAHYLSLLLTNSQYALLAFNDPFANHWNLLGAKEFLVTTSYLNNLHSVRILWGAQTGAIVVGHIVGIVVAHCIAGRLYATALDAIKSQLMLAVLMIVYTLFGLWLLSTPTLS